MCIDLQSLVFLCTDIGLHYVALYVLEKIIQNGGPRIYNIVPKLFRNDH